MDIYAIPEGEMTVKELAKMMIEGFTKQDNKLNQLAGEVMRGFALADKRWDELQRRFDVIDICFEEQQARFDRIDEHLSIDSQQVSRV